ncbi:glycosyltransferase [Aureispira sp. CCB-QB1]|uniref:glycosyltransferase n=2 Tax=unclassified Aureispira TaxID=2649989 RepID=UPI0018CC00B4|nr:glycosyltransferase [Aureispira sp. CCB-QB1]
MRKVAIQVKPNNYMAAKNKKKSSRQAQQSRKYPENKYQGKLSIVIPVYNEEDGLQTIFRELQKVEQNWKLPYEVIFVNNGSSDDTLSVINQTYNNEGQSEQVSYEVIDLEEHQTVAAALKAGVAQATGNHILTWSRKSQEEGESPINWLRKLAQEDWDDSSIIVGVRNYVEGESTTDGIVKKLSNGWVQLWSGMNVVDVEAPFRLYPQTVGKLLFDKLSSKSKTPDLEVIHYAHLYDLAIVEASIDNVKKGASSTSTGNALTNFVNIFKNIFNFFWIDSIKEMKVEHSLSNWKQANSIYRFLFAALSLLVLFMLPYLSFDYGITGDEGFQEKYGTHVLNYFETEGVDDNALNFVNLYFYGGIFDYTVTWMHKYVFTTWDLFEVRHMFNALVGAILFVFVGLLSYSVTRKWKIAFWTIILVIFFPRLFGHAMNNPKDIPFAAGYIISIYFMMNFVRQLPRPSLNSIVGLIVGISLTMGMRSGGIIIIPYLFLFTGGMHLLNTKLRAQLFNFKYLIKLGSILVAIVVLGYFGGILYWPYALEDPLNNPFYALQEMSNFSVGIRMLWEGQHYWSEYLPWYYVPKWLVTVLPLVVLLGLIFAIVPIVKDTRNRIITLMLAFTALFPVAYVIYKDSALYDGIRHFLFVCPPLIILATYGYFFTIDYLKPKAAKIGVYVIFFGLLALPVRWTIAAHPHQYTYFNEFMGGIEGAFGAYETDYWMNSTKEAVDWVIENIPEVKAGEEVRFGTQAHLPINHYFKDYPNVKVIYTRYHERAKHNWDYGIYISRFINKKALEQDVWPAGNELLHAVKVDNVPLCMISKRSETNKKSVEAAAAFKAKDYAKAIALLQEVLKENPKDDSALMLLTQYALQAGNTQLAKETVTELHKYMTDYSNAYGMEGICYMQMKDAENAEKCFSKAVECNPKYTFGHYHLANLLVQKQELNKAIEHLELFDQYGGKPAQGYDLAINICQHLGNDAKKSFFMAKKLSTQGKWQEAMQNLNVALSILPDYKPALKMKKMYDDAVRKQMLATARKERLKREGKIK